MISGTIKNWDQTQGWGFIEGDDGEDHFINSSNVRLGQIIRLNCRVRFDVFEGQRGPEAENIALF
jgi:CspA family cold shock protein